MAGEIRLTCPTGLPQDAKVEVQQEDGSWVTLRGVAAVSFKVEAGDFSRATLDVFAFQIDALVLPESVRVFPSEAKAGPERRNPLAPTT